MSVSNQTVHAVPVKVYYDHGRDALALALSVADMQEERALRKAEKHHTPQAASGASKQTQRTPRRKRLAETKATIAKRRAEAKKEKTRSRKEAKSRLRRGGDANITAPEETAGAAPRKRVSFA